MNKTAFGAAWLTGILFLSCVGYLAFLASDRTLPITDVRTAIIPASGATITPGARAEINVHIFYRFGCGGIVHRQLYDAKGVRYPVSDLPLTVSDPGAQVSATPLMIPVQFALGEGRYVSQPEYACNWFQRWFWPLEAPERTAAFMVFGQ